MTIVGLTGGIGSGKTAVASMFAECGATVISGDEIARELVVPGSPQLARIVEHFGQEILNDDGTLNRQALADRVFSDLDELDALNDIMDAPIQRAIDARASTIDGVVVIESPLLVERGRADSVDVVVVVMAPMDDRLTRLTEDRGLSMTDAMARISRQASDDERIKAADYVIVNDGTMENAREQVRHVWERLT